MTNHSHKIYLRLLILLLSASVLPYLRAQDGSTAYNFLNITSSAKVYGLGGVNISLIDDDITLTEQNPALLGQEMSNHLAINYMRYLGGSNFTGARYGHSVGSHGTWAAAIQYFGYGSMKEILPDGSEVGNFSASDVAFSGVYSHDITDRLRGGVNFKALYSSYAEFSAFALATDLGLNYYNEDNDLSLSLVVANLGGQVKRFHESYDRLPFDIRLGWSQSFSTFPLRFSITAWNLTKWKLPYYSYSQGGIARESERKESFGSNLFRHLVFGIDLIASPNYYVALGYNYKTRTDMSTYNRSFISGFSIGGGFNVKNFGVSLALSQPHNGATTFMFNLKCDIGQFLQ